MPPDDPDTEDGHVCRISSVERREGEYCFGADQSALDNARSDLERVDLGEGCSRGLKCIRGRFDDLCQ